MNKIIVIMGPTACGKTDLAMYLTHKIPAEIISVDSAMIYREMNIGTAKPSVEALKIAPHRLINVCDPAEIYSAGRFCEDAVRAMKDIHANNHVPLLVGGTMLYFHKLLFGLAELPTADKNIRDTLTQEAKQIGWSAMHEQLRVVDPVAAAKIKPQDSQRIQRALEVFLLTGKPISELQKKSESFLLQHYHVTLIALIPADRAWLHDRIANRFEKMLEMGFIDEVRALHQRPDLHADLPSMRIVGYRQAWEYLDGKIDYDTMKQKAIAATRQLAKRQLTWLRRWKNVMVLDPRDPQVNELVDERLRR
ncbi:MAG: tRNA (adenosine(37)-N6)-dimethylallyltransferase MiaA [Gammaproteobacteria bacterium RIFCSPHIGHO2_02_FULL_39_13]|nr:MAG: tRNA (adenosine(37)-N6)-dimethylallyltransferase MiaA [Gammaproteobacteria bacterium RIFCSPHIGHO2_02_FULL_39_13]OGT49632.1 MAG: tRNA (adenosine(37)-N6)-dimethylallyltransferase MiaA [Gammaproteobacteria bacterium RIFCSPHIGHO2_12_FULL_39_24]